MTLMTLKDQNEKIYNVIYNINTQKMKLINGLGLQVSGWRDTTAKCLKHLTYTERTYSTHDSMIRELSKYIRDDEKYIMVPILRNEISDDTFADVYPELAISK